MYAAYQKRKTLFATTSFLHNLTGKVFYDTRKNILVFLEEYMILNKIKNNITNFLYVPILLAISFIALNAHANYQSENYEEPDMKEINKEFSKLKENIKEYSEKTAENIKKDAKHHMEKFNKKYNEISSTIKGKVSDLYEETTEAYEKTKQVSKEQRKKAYDTFVSKMEKLNEAIEKANKDK